MSKHTGYELWRGPSRINGEPIVVIITGVEHMFSRNNKTGELAQVWILLQNESPGDGIRSGKDEAICGPCPLRGGICYVNVGWAPLAIWKAFRRDKYPRIRTKTSPMIQSLKMRIGAYGDPVAVPLKVWARTVPHWWTGYTHLWRMRGAKAYQDFLMASVGSEAEAEEALSEGWRPFLMVALDRSIPRKFVWCPSDELNPAPKVLCENCFLCNGGSGKAVAIYAHGKSANTFGSIQRHDRLPVTKRPLANESLIRVDPERHARLKLQAKERRMSMRKLSALALDKEMNRYEDRRDRKPVGNPS